MQVDDSGTEQAVRVESDPTKWFFYKFPEFVGKSLGCQMLRTITVTELHSDATMDNDELRQLADWMGHQLCTAQETYARS